MPLGRAPCGRPQEAEEIERRVNGGARVRRGGRRRDGIRALDGRRLARRIDHLVCRGGDDPMSSEELFAKFEDCAGRALAHDQIAALFERLETLETVADLGQVARLLEPRVLPSEAAARFTSIASASLGGSGEETSWVP